MHLIIIIFTFSSRIIAFTSDDLYSWRGYFFAGLIFVVDCFGKICNNNILYYEGATSVQFQVALMGSLFRKVRYDEELSLTSANILNYLVHKSWTPNNWLSVSSVTGKLKGKCSFHPGNKYLLSNQRYRNGTRPTPSLKLQV